MKKPLILCLRIEYLILNYSYYWKNLLEMNVRFFLLLRQIFRSLSPLLSHFLSHMHTHTHSLSDATSSFSVELWNFYGLTLVARNRKVSSFFVVIAN